jgi:hypothetical protein
MASLLHPRLIRLIRLIMITTHSILFIFDVQVLFCDAHFVSIFLPLLPLKKVDVVGSPT